MCGGHGELPCEVYDVTSWSYVNLDDPLALFDHAKQAMGEGKSGPVETGLTGPSCCSTYSDRKLCRQCLKFSSDKTAHSLKKLTGTP